MKIFRNKWFWIFILICGVISLSCYHLWNFLALDTPRLSPGDSALQNTRELLSAAATKPLGRLPDEIPGYLRVGEDCWEILQQGMRKNTNHFKLTITEIYDSRDDPHAVHDLTEVYLNIEFPDGHTVEMFGMNGGLNSCKEK